MSKSKAKGTLAETAVTSYLNDQGILCVRNPAQGAKDKGDINLLSIPVAIEVKNHQSMHLPAWIDEAIAEKSNASAEVGVVVHKRLRKGDPAAWFATMTVADLVTLIKKAYL